MRGFIRGACVVLFGGACVVLFGGHAWFYSGGMRGFIWGGSMRGFIRGACVVNERAVRILLQCILVLGSDFTKFSINHTNLHFAHLLSNVTGVIVIKRQQILLKVSCQYLQFLIPIFLPKNSQQLNFYDRCRIRDRTEEKLRHRDRFVW